MSVMYLLMDCKKTGNIYALYTCLIFSVSALFARTLKAIILAVVTYSS